MTFNSTSDRKGMRIPLVGLDQGLIQFVGGVVTWLDWKNHHIKQRRDARAI